MCKFMSWCVVMRMKNGNGFKIEYWPLIAIFMLNYKALYHSPCRTKSIRLHLYYIGSSMRYKSNLDCHLYILKQSIQIKYNFKHTYYAKSSKQTKSSTCLCIKILYYWVFNKMFKVKHPNALTINIIPY